MSKLEKLIQQYCPDGVEYKRTEDLATTLIGEFVHKNKQREGAPYPVYNGGSSNTGFYDEYNREANCIIVSARGANAGFVNKITTRFWSGNSCYTIIVNDKNLLWTFAYYWFKSNERRLLGEQQKGGIPAISKKQIEDFKIPVPPLPVQEEIVRVLDAFTELQAELQAELQKRKQQYNFYLDNLLNFKNINRGGQAEVRWMKLKNVCMKTSNIKWKSTTGQYRYIDLSSVDIQTHSIISTIEIDKMSAPSRAQQIVQEDDVIFATTRPTQMRACIIPTEYNGDICSTGYCILRADRNILLPKFLFFSMTTSTFKIYLSNNLTLGNYPSISNSALMGYEIPVPPIAEQQKIVSILDRFDTLTNDLTSGLPAEIEKRRQQYEFYRDKLLTFKRKEA